MSNEINGILQHYEWKEGNTLFCKDHTGEIFRFHRNYETLTGNTKKALFVKAKDPNGTIYERKIKKVKIGIRKPARVIFSNNYTEKQFESNKAKTRYEIIGYRFTPFPPKPTTSTYIDEKPFIDRLAHASYKNMLLADIKLIFTLKHEFSIELSKFLDDIQECYQDNFENPSETDQFIEIVKTLIKTTKTPSDNLYFSLSDFENQTFISKN